ncbi:MAG: hypothetical protein KF767_17535 [Bdellovibrionaceae bacterium]|nr:hypothetical protein [Pseudobdellovibrionaceae bacterium]
MDSSNTAWGLLLQALGTYEGRGLNHERETFRSELTLSTKLPDKVLALQSSAIGEHGEIFHQEMSWIGRDDRGQIQMWVASNNHPSITVHSFDRLETTAECQSVIFSYGDPSDRESFREEITLCIFTDGQLAHQYAWGLPGGDFKPRSGSKMKKKRAASRPEAQL